MMDLMSSIIMEGDGVTQELLDTILINLIPAHKVGNTHRPYSCSVNCSHHWTMTGCLRCSRMLKCVFLGQITN